MRVLLDTCILSELYRSGSNNVVTAALAELPGEALFISVISMGELIKGVALLDAGKRKTALEHWLQTLELTYAKQILSIDAEVVRIWGEITARAQRAGKIIPAADGLIAATAMNYGLHVMTRNVADFLPTGVMVLNPWG